MIKICIQKIFITTSLLHQNLLNSSSRNHGIGKLDLHIRGAHVGVRAQVVLQCLHRRRRLAIERISHGAVVRVHLIPQPTERVRIVAVDGSVNNVYVKCWFCNNLLWSLLVKLQPNAIAGVVGNHHKQIESHALGVSFGQQHMVRPSTAAEAEPFQIVLVRDVLRGFDLSEGTVVRNRYGGLVRSTG